MSRSGIAIFAAAVVGFVLAVIGILSGAMVLFWIGAAVITACSVLKFALDRYESSRGGSSGRRDRL